MLLGERPLCQCYHEHDNIMSVCLVLIWPSHHYRNCNSLLCACRALILLNSSSWSISIFLNLHSTLKMPTPPFNLLPLHHPLLSPSLFSHNLPFSLTLCRVSLPPPPLPNSFQHEIINGALGKFDKSINHL